ncbi:MAG TPA: hypothetical protein VI298_00030 [Geobacteraceae bacterium]
MKRGSGGRKIIPDRTMVITVVCVVVALLACLGDARADYYKYTDKGGAVCITNNLDAVPRKYRATMKVIREETLDKKGRGADREGGAAGAAPPETASQAQEQNNVAPAGEPTSAYGRLAARFPWFKPLLFVGAALAVFILVTKLSSVLPSPLLSRVIYLAFFLGLFVIVYKSYADHVTESYFTIKTKVLAMFEKANRREMPEPGELPPAAPGKEQTSP